MKEVMPSIHDFPFIDECILFEGTNCTKCGECKKKEDLE